MGKQKRLMALIALPFPPRWLPGFAFGAVAGVAALLIFLAAVRGL